MRKPHEQGPSDHDGSDQARPDETIVRRTDGGEDSPPGAAKAKDDGVDRTMARSKEPAPPAADRTLPRNPAPPRDDAGQAADRTSLRRPDAAKPAKVKGVPPATPDGIDRTMRRPGESGEIDQTMRRPGEGEAIDRTMRRPGEGEAIDRTMRRPGDGEADRTLRREGGHADAPGEEVDPLVGTILGGCRIEKRLGAGGMGTVYRARQIDLDRDVAVKTIRPEFAGDAESLKRFQREAKAVGKFRTQHVVQIYQVGNERGVPYLVLELLPGGSLREYAERQPEGRISADDAIRYLREAALALSDAARMGMVHRDVKPDNFLLDENGTLKVTDFGISKFAQQDASLSLTMGGIIGTPMYMSPEQCRGEELDFRSDMWSLGATFFFLLTGEPPAKGSSLLELIRTKNEVRNLDPSKILPDAIPGPLSEVIRRLTMLDREERYRTYDELLTDLEAVAAGRAVVRRSRIKVGWIVAVLAVGAAALGVQQGWPKLAAMFASKPVDPVDGPGTGTPNGPTAEDLASLATKREELKRIEAAVQVAADTRSLGALDEDVRKLQSEIDSKKGEGFERLRADALATAREIGNRINELQPREARMARETALQTLRARLDANEDAQALLGEVDAFVAAIPVGEEWSALRDDARRLRLACAAKRYERQLATLRADFVANGPKSVSTASNLLVEDLQRESAPEFATLRASAGDLNRDVQAARDLEQNLPGVPELRSPFAEVVAWQKRVNQDIDAALQSAKTEEFRNWTATLRTTALAAGKVGSGVTAALTALWTECKTEHGAGALAKTKALMAELAMAQQNAVALGIDVAAVVPPAEHAAIEQWVASMDRTESAIATLAASQPPELATLEAWLGARDAIAAERERIAREAAAAGAAEDPRIQATLRRFDDLRTEWSQLTAGLEQALTSIAAARLVAAKTALDKTPRGDRPEPADFGVVRQVISGLQGAYQRAAVTLELEDAVREFQAAIEAAKRLPEALGGRAACLAYAQRGLAKTTALIGATRDMAPVLGASIRIELEGLAARDETVRAFYIDRWETDRAAFKRWLDEGASSNVSEAVLSELRSRDWSSRLAFPAVRIPREAAIDCLRASGRTLPTHAEWWLAAKGEGSKQGFPWGDDWSAGGVEAREQPLEVRADAQPLRVGSRRVEVAFLVGNAAEWLADSVDDVTQGVVAGGGFGYRLGDLREAARGATFRVDLSPRDRRMQDCVGFRGVVRPHEQFGADLPKD